MFTRLIRLLVIAAALLTACDNDSAYVTETDVQNAVRDGIKAGLPTCTPGRTVDCPCPGGMMGSQTCEHDGISYGPCVDCAPPSSSSSSSSGSSSSSSGGGQMMQQIMCTGMGNAKALYPGMKATDLFGIRVAQHDPNFAPHFTVGGAEVDDGYAIAGCPGDYDIFIGP